ncbi:MAG: DUF308 domain-containing protein [Xanthobacteraceae bacterium]|nr:DUF308 domain-containing protein [Xanthobacteraceae bacterium]
MMVGMLVAGIGLVLAGLLAIGYGFTIKEFSTGNTLILSGVIGVCAGAIMFALWVAVRELKNIARRLGGSLPEARREISVRPVLPPGASPLAPPVGGPAFGDQPSFEATGAAPPPWQDAAASPDHPRGDQPEAGPADTAPPAVRPKRNLMFSSTSRKERERAQARTSEPLPPDLLSPDIRPNPSNPPLPAESAEPPPASFDDAWPKSDRARPGDVPPQRRAGRTPSTFEANGAPAGDESQSAVTVLKSGVVDGMAYSLYSDGSIEAQMPEGMMRFASIDELRAHLDQRP